MNKHPVDDIIKKFLSDRGLLRRLLNKPLECDTPYTGETFKELINWYSSRMDITGAQLMDFGKACYEAGLEDGADGMFEHVEKDTDWRD